TGTCRFIRWALTTHPDGSVLKVATCLPSQYGEEYHVSGAGLAGHVLAQELWVGGTVVNGTLAGGTLIEGTYYGDLGSGNLYGSWEIASGNIGQTPFVVDIRPTKIVH